MFCRMDESISFRSIQLYFLKHLFKIANYNVFIKMQLLPFFL